MSWLHNEDHPGNRCNAFADETMTEKTSSSVEANRRNADSRRKSGCLSSQWERQSMQQNVVIAGVSLEAPLLCMRILAKARAPHCTVRAMFAQHWHRVRLDFNCNVETHNDASNDKALRVHTSRVWKMITTDIGYQIPTILYRTNTAIQRKPSSRLPP